MRFFFTLILSFATVVSCFCQSGFQFEKNQKKTVIPFQLINNLIFIPIEVNGETLTFLLDTGVEETVLFSLDDKEQVSFFNMEKIMLKGLGSNEAVAAYKSSKNKLDAKGFIDLEHEIYLVLDQEFNFSSQVGIPVNGIIGYHFFKNHLVEIDYDRKKVIVYNESNQKIRKRMAKSYHKESITIENNKPYYVTKVVTAEQSRPCKMLIDTGNSDAIWLFLSEAEDIKLPAKSIQCFLGRGFSGNVYGQRARIDNFSFGNKTFKNPIGTFPDSTSLRSVNFVENRVGSLGGEVLSRFSVFFDYQNNCLYSKPGAKIGNPFNFNMSGLEVQHDGLEWVTQTYQDRSSTAAVFKATQGSDGHVQDNLKIKFELKPVFRIFNVREGSTAAQAGVKKDDRIISINGRNTHYLTIENINELLKSEEGRTIVIEVERKGVILTYKFQLKSIL
ncbi:aspartyl protease family protein [Flavobacterium sp. J49]|uniref:aspartyl protease family protein n=1 Tax=Flavobacterium sp. J49 TaxID=2718534 RepID=UPI001594CA2A|nr:aspartyl protease family protein [Flavobacterium sp. J49]MBF6640671.1 aspartyl protease family protein [Flavobacterium sp. J49]NIC01918.1 PDZ domain-containing protein [Flavobacterium sp. J49]